MVVNSIFKDLIEDYEFQVNASNYLFYSASTHIQANMTN